MPTPGRRCAVGWRSGTKQESPAARVGLHLAFGVGLGPAPEGVPVPRPAASAPGGSPTNQRAPSAPAGGGRGKSRPGGPAAPRAARADRKSKVAAWGVGRLSAALSGAHRIAHRKRGPGPRRPKIEGRGVGRGSAIGGPFRCAHRISAPETWAWATPSAGGRPRAGPRPRRGPDRVAVANVCERCGALVS